MPPLVRRLTAGLALVLLACGEEPLAPTTGTLAVSSVTHGDVLPADRFALSVDDGPTRPLGPNDALTVADVPSGIHSLRLDGIPAYCGPLVPNPVSATVPAGDTARVVFELTCAAGGTLHLTTATSGEDLDPDGYIVTVDQAPGVAVPANGAVSIGRLRAGDHRVLLSGLAANCTLGGTNPRTLTIVARQTTEAGFELSCRPLPPPEPGSIAVTTRSGGTFTDPDGYTVVLDGRESQPIAIAGSVIFSNVPPGSHVVRLDDLAAGCGFLLANPQTVTVVSGQVARVEFNVLCVP